jgi:hypothetical protein
MKTDIWLTQIDKITNDFRQIFGALTDEQLNWRPNEQTWSIAQNIDHLIIINESYYPIIKAVKNGTYKRPFVGKFNFIVRFFGEALLRAVQPDRRKKSKTFPIWEPNQSIVLTEVLDKFEKHQEGLKAQIRDSEDLLAKGAVISSPANSKIVYKLEAAFDIMVAHEQRHFEQAKELLKMLPE